MSYYNYYPFGMEQPGRCLNPDNYRYGFNGMEKDNEVKGGGNSYTTPFRQYDPRLGRWMTQDPIVHPWNSPFTAFNDNPIYFSDPSGLDPETTENSSSSSSDVGFESGKGTNDNPIQINEIVIQPPVKEPDKANTNNQNLENVKTEFISELNSLRKDFKGYMENIFKNISFDENDNRTLFYKNEKYTLAADEPLSTQEIINELKSDFQKKITSTEYQVFSKLLEPLVENQRVSDILQDHAIECSNSRITNHNAAEVIKQINQGIHHGDEIALNDVDVMSGEMIVVGFLIDDGAHNAKSRGHRKTILNTSSSFISVGMSVQKGKAAFVFFAFPTTEKVKK